MDLKGLVQLGRIQKEVEVNKELKVKFHTLSTIEQQIALSSVPEAVDNSVARFAYLQAAVLSQATDDVNGETVTKEQAKELYDNIQYNILSELFTEYSLMAGEQDKVMEELKKK